MLAPSLPGWTCRCESFHRPHTLFLAHSFLAQRACAQLNEDSLAWALAFSGSLYDVDLRGRISARHRAVAAADLMWYWAPTRATHFQFRGLMRDYGRKRRDWMVMSSNALVRLPRSSMKCRFRSSSSVRGSAHLC